MEMQIVEMETRAGYDLWSSKYDNSGNPLIALEEKYIYEALPELAGAQVLDLGCGTGRHSVKLAQMGAEVTALDFSEKMLDQARAKAGAGNMRFVHHDLRRRLPFADASFDFVISSLVFEHIEDIALLMAEIRRVAKPGASVVITDLHPEMRSRGAQAQFTDAERGFDIRVKGYSHAISDYAMGALDAGFEISAMAEHKGDAALVGKFPKMQKFVDMPMLFLMRLAAPMTGASDFYTRFFSDVGSLV